MQPFLQSFFSVLLLIGIIYSSAQDFIACKPAVTGSITTPCADPAPRCSWFQDCGSLCFCGEPPTPSMGPPTTDKVIRFCPQGWLAVANGCKAPPTIKQCPLGWLIIRRSIPVICDRPGQRDEPTPGQVSPGNTPYPSFPRFISPTMSPAGTTPRKVNNCPGNFFMTPYDDCEGPVGTITCPVNYRVFLAATATRGVVCINGISPASPVPRPVIAPQQQTVSITFTDIVIGVSLTTFQNSQGLSSYINDLALYLAIQPTQITATINCPTGYRWSSGDRSCVKTSRRSLQDDPNPPTSNPTPNMRSVSLTVTVATIINRAINVQTRLKSSQKTMSQYMANRGGVWASASIQGAVLPGDPTRKPSPAPTFFPTALPTRAPSAEPTCRPTFISSSSVPTDTPSIPPSEEREEHEEEEQHNEESAAGKAKKASGLSTGAYAGIGVSVFVILVLGVAFIVMQSKDKKGMDKEDIHEFYGNGNRHSNDPGPGFQAYVNTRGSIHDKGRGSGSFSGSSPVHDLNARASLNSNRDSFTSPKRPSFSAGTKLVAMPAAVGSGGRASVSRGSISGLPAGSRASTSRPAPGGPQYDI